jgi:hypothetical protein
MKEAIKKLTQEECAALYNKAWEQEYGKREKAKVTQVGSVEGFVKVLLEELDVVDCKCPNCGRPSTLNVLVGCPTTDSNTGITTHNIQCLGCLKKYKEKRK